MNTLLYIEAITNAILSKRFSLLTQSLGSLLGMLFVPVCLSFCEVTRLHYKHPRTAMAVVPQQVSLATGNHFCAQSATLSGTTVKGVLVQGGCCTNMALALLVPKLF